jgi:hypothetical protein
MIYNVVLKSLSNDEEVTVLTGFDGRPLRFTNKAYAEREAHERNIDILHWYEDDDLRHIVVEENIYDGKV